MCVGEFIKPCWWPFVFPLKTCPSVICILVHIGSWLWFVSTSICKKALVLDTSSRQTGNKLSLFQYGHNWCAPKGPNSTVVEIQLVCTVVSEFRRRGVGICQSLSEAAFVSDQCCQWKPQTSWCHLSGLCQLHIQHVPSAVGSTWSCWCAQQIPGVPGAPRHRWCVKTLVSPLPWLSSCISIIPLWTVRQRWWWLKERYVKAFSWKLFYLT